MAKYSLIFFLYSATGLKERTLRQRDIDGAMAMVDPNFSCEGICLTYCAAQNEMPGGNSGFVIGIKFMFNGCISVICFRLLLAKVRSD
jgi:hypothetical protein